MTLLDKMNNEIKIAFADLAHTGKNLSSRYFPYGVALVASYLKTQFSEVSIEIFKYPEDFSEYLKKNIPQIIGFYNSSWTQNINYEYVKRIKDSYPKTIIVFGGPNFPLEHSKQKLFFKSSPLVDFYIRGEGEIAFANLFQKLKELNFDLEEFKQNKIKTGNCYYLQDDELVIGEPLERIKDLDIIPSPYLSGMLDKFFNGILEPVIQTTRGCPFNCTYCQEGQSYFNNIFKFSLERIKQEIDYISQKAKVNELMFADSNFGIYPRDLEIFKELAITREKYDFPKFVGISSGINKKITMDALSVLKYRTMVAIPVQSTDREVLKNINRRNVPIEELISIAKEVRNHNAISFSEIILGLPGDSKEKHFKSILDMIESDIDIVRSHQFIMLPGSEVSKQEMKKKYNLVNRFRVQPRCFGEYSLYGKKFPAFEIDEICVANDTLPYEDYLECRRFNLTVEIFYNSVFRELINFLILKNISISRFILEIHKKIPDSEIKELYEEFIKENEDCLWESEHDLKKHMNYKGILRDTIDYNLRENEQVKYRALIILEKIKSLHDIAFEVAKEIAEGKLTSQEQIYLDELKKFSLLVKSDFFVPKDITEEFHYDFTELSKQQFSKDPSIFHIPLGIKIRFFNSEKQNKLIFQYIKQCGSSIEGLGYILSRCDIRDFYKEMETLNDRQS